MTANQRLIKVDTGKQLSQQSQHKPQLNTLSELWAIYVESRTPTLSISTLKNTYKTIAFHLTKIPHQSLNDALIIRDYFINNLKPNTAKKYLNNIRKCCDWAVESGYISNNPFLGLASEIKAKAKQLEDIKPFTKEEKQVIIAAFENDLYYSHYAAYVKFLFLTGCRTGEAIALQWKHISPDFKKISFCESYVSGNRKNTKTKKSRIFPCNHQLQHFLQSIQPINYHPESLVFPSPEGQEIDAHNFLNRAWKGYKNRHGHHIDGIITRLVKAGLVSEYRPQYNTRHTFITHCLEAGVTVPQVAQWVGSSSEVIMRHYAGITLQLEVPEF